jgi:curved DNA-binding protein
MSLNEDLDQSIKLDCTLIEAFQFRATIFENLKQFNNSILDLESVLKLNPKDSSSRNKIENLKKNLEVKTHYNILNLSEDSSFEEIERAFKKGLAKNHPDRFIEESQKNEATKMFQLIGEAFAVLGDSKMREQYDFSLILKKSTNEIIKDDSNSNSTTEMEFKTEKFNEYNQSRISKDLKTENQEPKNPNPVDKPSENIEEFKL